MSYQVRFTRAAKEDLQRLYQFLMAQDLPTTHFSREMVIPFGASGYVVLFEIEDHQTVTILARRHQHEEDYH